MKMSITFNGHNHKLAYYEMKEQICLPEQQQLNKTTF